jgi:hypothetical protein
LTPFDYTHPIKAHTLRPLFTRPGHDATHFFLQTVFASATFNERPFNKGIMTDVDATDSDSHSADAESPIPGLSGDPTTADLSGPSVSGWWSLFELGLLDSTAYDKTKIMQQPHEKQQNSCYLQPTRF